MSSINDQNIVGEGKLLDKALDVQLADRISAELVSQQLTISVKQEPLATKIATGQMKAEDWRIMAASTLRIDIEAKVGERGVNVNGDLQP